LESGGAILAGVMLLAFAPSLLQAGEIYKSVDAQGHVVYSDRADTAAAQKDQIKQAQCDRAREHYYSLKDARRIYDRDAEGNRVFLSDPDADAKREEARQAMAAACEM
jgi:hypothetical protein